MAIQRYIRGSGLAYGAYVGADLESGHVTFSLYRVSVILMLFSGYCFDTAL
jgi:Zn-dependent M16 (insulinase) family peptidase